MSCQLDEFGNKNCYIVQHPDRPYESFCDRCKQRFENKQTSERFPWLLALLLAIAVWMLIPKPAYQSTSNQSQQQQLR